MQTIHSIICHLIISAESMGMSRIIPVIPHRNSSPALIPRLWMMSVASLWCGGPTKQNECSRNTELWNYCRQYIPICSRNYFSNQKQIFGFEKCRQCSLLLFQGICLFFAIMPLAEIKHSSFNVPLARFIDCPVCQHNPSCRYRLLNSGEIKRKWGLSVLSRSAS